MRQLLFHCATVPLLAATAHAAERPEAANGDSGAGTMPDSTIGAGSVFQMVGGLVLVLGVIFLLAWAVRRFGRLNLHTGNSLRVVSALSMGTRERVVLVQAGETQILLGVAPGRVQTLHVLDKPVTTEDAGAGPGSVSFSDRLRQAVSRGRSQ